MNFTPAQKEVNVKRIVIYSFVPILYIYALWRIKKFMLLSLILIPVNFATSFLFNYVEYVIVIAVAVVSNIIFHIWIVRYYARKYNLELLK